MADILLDVPYVTQVNIGGHVVGATTRTENNGCWYAAVCMLGYYRSAGPRLGVPAQYVKPDGSPQGVDKKGHIQPDAMGARYADLVKNENLTMVPLPGDDKWTADKLSTILADCGPCYMRTKLYNQAGKFLGGHILVLIGAKTSNDTIVYHDPAKKPSMVMTVDRLNQIFNWDKNTRLQYSMMCKPAEPVTRPRSSAVSTPIVTRSRSNAFSTPPPVSLPSKAVPSKTATPSKLVIGGHKKPGT